jgi:hypothetical protein
VSLGCIEGQTILCVPWAHRRLACALAVRQLPDAASNGLGLKCTGGDAYTPRRMYRGTDNPFCPHESKKAKECFSLLTFHLPLKKNGGEGGIAALSLTLIALVRRYRTSLKRAVALRDYA